MKDKAVQVDFAKMETLIMASHSPSIVKGMYQLGSSYTPINWDHKNCTHLGCQRGLGLHKCPDLIEWKSESIVYLHSKRLPPVYKNKDWNKS